MDLPRLLDDLGPDLLAFAASLVLLLAYYAVHRAHVQRDPARSIQAVNELSRRLWVEHVMSRQSLDVMAVQTLRNFIMVGILMVSTATLLIIGTLTLSGQGEPLARTWQVLHGSGSASQALRLVKIMFLLADFLVVLFSFTMSIRIANQVLFMVNIPAELRAPHPVLSVGAVAQRLNRAGRMVSIGMRSLFYAIPLVFWLFGPVFLVLAAAGLVLALASIDRQSPSA